MSKSTKESIKDIKICLDYLLEHEAKHFEEVDEEEKQNHIFKHATRAMQILQKLEEEIPNDNTGKTAKITPEGKCSICGGTSFYQKEVEYNTAKINAKDKEICIKSDSSGGDGGEVVCDCGAEIDTDDFSIDYI